MLRSRGRGVARPQVMVLSKCVHSGKCRRELQMCCEPRALRNWGTEFEFGRTLCGSPLLLGSENENQTSCDPAVRLVCAECRGASDEERVFQNFRWRQNP